MSLAAVNWRFVGSSSFAIADVNNVLDALFALGTALVYADGTTRTPGVGSAGTYTRVIVADGRSVVINPAVNTLNQRIIYAGATLGGTVGTPMMSTVDTSATNGLMCGVAKNAGAFTAWNTAGPTGPFTSGQFTGYVRSWLFGGGIGSVYLYESTEGVLVEVLTASGASGWVTGGGALVDPETTDVLDAESDGKVYGVSTSGSAAIAGTTWLSGGASTTAALFANNVTSGTSHFYTFVPGSGTLYTTRLAVNFITTGTSTGLKTRSGKYGRFGLFCQGSTATPNDNIVGTLRGITGFFGATGTKQVDGATAIGYVLGPKSTAQHEAFLLVH